MILERLTMMNEIIIVDGREYLKLECGHCKGTGTCPHGNSCAECRGAWQRQTSRKLGGGLWGDLCASVVDADAKYKCRICDGDGYKIKRVD